MGETSVSLKWHKVGDHVRVNYGLKGRTHDALTYNVLAPNGSSITLFTQDGGISVVWSGGRPFSPVGASASKQKYSQTDSSVMMIDSDEDVFHQPSVDQRTGSGRLAYVDVGETEYDSFQPFDKPLLQRWIAIDGNPVSLAQVSGLPFDCAELKVASIPQIFHSKAVIAVGCSDTSVKLLMFNLAPSKSPSHFEPEIFDIIAPNTVHRSICRHISLSFTTADPYASTAVDEQRNFEDGMEDEAVGHDLWKILVASQSADPVPVLAISDILLKAKGLEIDRLPTPTSGIVQHYLTSPLKALSFCQARFPSRRHQWLMTADYEGAVKIAEMVPRQRTRVASRTLAHILKWQLSLHVPYAEPGSKTDRAVVIPRRQAILDAQWTIRGKAIVVLLESGTWGLWDVDGAGPYSRKASASGITGSITTRFALRGRLGSIEESEHTINKAESSIAHDKKLAPMTPNTRKAKQSNLFGQIPRTIQRSMPTGKLASTDDSLLLQFNNIVYHEPDLLSYWQRTINRGEEQDASFGSWARELTPVSEVSTGGQNIIRLSKTAGAAGSSSPSDEIFVAAEKHLVFWTKVKREPSLATTYDTSMVLHGAEQSNDVEIVDRDLLTRNELDLDGIDRALDSMQGDGAANGSQGLLGRADDLGAFPPLFEGSKPGRRVEFAAR